MATSHSEVNNSDDVLDNKVVTKLQKCHHLDWQPMDKSEIAYNAEKSWSTAVVTSGECYGCNSTR